MNFPQLFRSKPYVFSMVYVFFITYVMCSSFGVIFTADLKCQILVACDLKSQFVFAVICNRWDTCGDYVLYFTYTLTLCCFCIVIYNEYGNSTFLYCNLQQIGAAVRFCCNFQQFMMLPHFVGGPYRGHSRFEIAVLEPLHLAMVPTTVQEGILHITIVLHVCCQATIV